jgi:hypothetical protein
MPHLAECRCLDCLWNRQLRLAVAAWALAWEVEGL